MIVIYERLSAGIAIFESKAGSVLEIKVEELPAHVRPGEAYQVEWKAAPEVTAAYRQQLQQLEQETRSIPD
ncbi:MAG: hypothetical protein D6675_11590 [Gemmatimonadetes bacterium]|nr:MAG: hypothetical protein D6675_11590 [Gemmatimonadota bacterium]